MRIRAGYELVCPQCGDDQLITRTGGGHRVSRCCRQCGHRWTRCEDPSCTDRRHWAHTSN